MPVMWSWKHKIGKIIVQRKNSNGEKYKFSVNIYAGDNCYCVFLTEYKDSETGKDMYNFWSFFGNTEHINKLLKNKEDVMFGHGDNVLRVELNMFYRCEKLVEYFTKVGYKVVCTYKVPKIKDIDTEKRITL